MLEIRIRYLKEGMQEIGKTEKGDWIDLRASEDVSMKAGDFRLIPLGVAMKLPEGYEAHLAPRSSTYKNFGIIQANSVGVIDNSYSGDEDEWKMPAIAMRDTEIHAGDRICQFRIMERQPNVALTRTDRLSGPSRGGFGSTGKS